MDPEALRRCADANRAYLVLENEVAAIFAAEAGEAEGTVETRWEHSMLNGLRAMWIGAPAPACGPPGWRGALSRRSGCPGPGLLMKRLVRGPGRRGRYSNNDMIYRLKTFARPIHNLLILLASQFMQILHKHLT